MQVRTSPATDQPDAMEEVLAHLWVLASAGRLAARGLLEAPAPADDPVAVASQRLLVEAGWLAEDPIRPSDRLLAAVPPGLSVASLAGYVPELLAHASRFADGVAPGWAESDPELIRWRGASSKMVVNNIFTRCYPSLPGFPDRLSAPGAAFLDVGVGAGGIAMEMCRQFPELRVVGLDISPPALAVARADVLAAGLADRIDVRAQSVAEIEDVDAFDLMWVPQPFLPPPVLDEALPRLHRAARAGAALIMVIQSHQHTGLAAHAADLHNLMNGGGTLRPADAERLLTAAGFASVDTVTWPGWTVMIALR